MSVKGFADQIVSSVLGADDIPLPEYHHLDHRFDGIMRIGRRNTECQLDLLPAAWRVSDAEFEAMLGVDEGYLADWRGGKQARDSELVQLGRLIALHHALKRIASCPLDYAKLNRMPCPESCGSNLPIVEAVAVDRDMIERIAGAL